VTTQAAVCQQCGRAVEAGAQFCAQCGANVSDAQGSAATAMLAPASVTAQIQDLLLDQLREAALGEYEILTELGRGGMATVYLAHDIQLDRKVAIKVMLPALLEGEGMVERFKLEARTAGQLSHPHIIPIFAVRDTDNLLFFVMKFVEGRPLDSIVSELGPAPIPIAQFVLSKVGEALGYAHRRGVVHRDIKPANIMVDIEGLPVVTDFGIAKVASSKGLTMTGATVGTPTYMSPEQCAAGAITGASDQYSLGVVGYEMLAGKTPFQADTVVGLLYKHCHEPPPPFLDVRPDCPPALHDAVMRMLAKKPADRFPSLEEAIEAIGAVSLAYGDPSRAKLMEMAKASSNVALLKRVSTPRSPTPVRSKMVKRTAVPGSTQRGAGVTARQAPGSAQLATVVAPQRGPGRTLAWAAVALVVLAGAAAAVLRPWQRAGAPQRPVAGANGPAVTSLAIQPPPGPVEAGTSIQLSATALDSAGQQLTAPIAWSSSNPSVATVSPGGLVQAIASGVTTILASSGTRQSSTQLTVSAAAGTPAPGTPASRVPAAHPAPAASVGAASAPAAPAPSTPRVASVAVTSPPGALTIGATTRLSATVTGDDGRPLAAPVAWRSADPSVATVSDGLVTAVGAGSTAITASAEGHDATASVRVSAPEPSRPAAPPPAAAAPAVDPREAIADVVTQYARALESGQASEVRRIYPGLSRTQADQVQALGTYQDLQVRLTPGAIDVRGNDATTTATGEYQFYSRENHRTEHLPVRLRIALQNGADGWHIRSVQ
jgi:eukaryotic-like serine/threonine-protein kinase